MQSIYYNNNLKELTVSFEKMTDLSLNKFINWLIIQRQLIEKLLPFQRLFNEIYNLKYEEFKREFLQGKPRNRINTVTN